ncbi:MAG: VapC toxin family PIN domain ribonuclease [Marinosulfonomonas sp.]|nr:MAG: VapC toxin family PIN domain ribonuclease [Marinosulfonomonas sp.]
MIILDTNVISEPLKPNPDPKVIDWLDDQDPSRLFVTAITQVEMEYGLWSLPNGRKRASLHNAITELFEVDFRGRILPFDTMAALMFGGHIATVRQSGKAVSDMDGMIAAIAISNDRCPIATRDASPFEAMKVEVINPWA